LRGLQFAYDRSTMCWAAYFNNWTLASNLT
jgi:hypothetical protein